MTRVVLVTGSRDWTDEAAIARALEGATLVIHGGSGGADRIADDWARAEGVKREVFRADWARHGSRAGPRRNQAMVDFACALRTNASVEVHAFPLPGSRGTWDCVRRARAAGLVVHVWGERAPR